jgi:hypothetical protein
MTWTVALAFRRVSVRCSHDRRIELAGAYNDIVEVSHLAKPQQDASTDLGVRAHEEPMVVFDLSLVELQHQCAVGEQPFVLRATMITAKTEELLIPAAGYFHIAYGDHRLGLSCANGDHDADAIAGWVFDLDKPALTTIELGASMHCATVGDDASEGAVQVVGGNPQNRSASRGRRLFGRELADYSRCFKASARGVD